jgi:hypothetical protein
VEVDELVRDHRVTELLFWFRHAYFHISRITEEIICEGSSSSIMAEFDIRMAESSGSPTRNYVS